MPPGRPIVSDTGSESYNISKYLEFFLKPLANKHPTYIKNTAYFLEKIKNVIIPPDALLVTGDVTALYTNMIISRTLAIVKIMFKRHPDPNRPDGHIIRLLDITVNNNDFTFNNIIYIYKSVV